MLIPQIQIMMPPKRKVTTAQKKLVAGRQHFKCANKPGSGLRGLENYLCPRWACADPDTRGSFDESGYEIDHIMEHSITQDDNLDNLQALCKSCHAVKTKKFLIGNNRSTKKTSHIGNTKCTKHTKRTKNKIFPEIPSEPSLETQNRQSITEPIAIKTELNQVSQPSTVISLYDIIQQRTGIDAADFTKRMQEGLRSLMNPSSQQCHSSTKN